MMNYSLSFLNYPRISPTFSGESITKNYYLEGVDFPISDYMNQTTLKQPFTLEGIGLHTGATVKMTCLPAEAGTGVLFRRVDLDSVPEIPASITLVDSTFRSTCLAKNDVIVCTTEHLLSAFAGLGLDNVIVELTGPEIPILDGSALPFIKAIQASGLEDQQVEKEYLELSKQIEFRDEKSGAEYLYIPVSRHEDSEYTSIIEYNSKVGRQVAVYNGEIDYPSEIAPARTFVFVNELEELHRKGVIKGGRVDNAIVFSHKDFSQERVKKLANHFNVDDDLIVDNGILNGLTLNYPNEPARNEYLKAKKLNGLPLYDPNQTPVKDINQVKEYIPHRYPFLLVDKIIELSDQHVVGIKNVTANESFFPGHFPDNPVFPGVLQMEALAQTGGILALSTVDDPTNWNTYFIKMDKVKFKKLVKPGDTMILKMELLSPIRRGIFQMQGTVYVGETIVSQGELTAQISKKNNTA